MQRPFWSTLADHGLAGFLYDSSVAFNEAPGFRLGIAFPHYPYHPLEDRSIAALQIPVIAMDGAFFYREGQTVEQTIDHVRRLLATLKQYEGVGSIDWHVRTSFPGSDQYRDWGNAYLALLDLLASDPEIAVMNCADVAQYYHEQLETVAHSKGLPGG
jgi:hypothetical protein